ncbi:pilus assembly FimT family protein [Psychrobacillus psychrotolerans]|uniref:pilus assembly FimT family protein n=2 Tax=Psychrobacillus psychrotolerans TaxID=126156 RepID=UPI003C713868
MNNNILNQKGLTLIELLASLIITITLSFFAFNLLTKGLDHYENIKYTNSLRDEADYLMALLVKEIYTTKETEISTFPDKFSNRNYFIVTNSGSTFKTGFENGRLLIHGELFNTNNKNISISNNSTLEKVDNGLYKINLILINKKRNNEIQFENEIRTINDKEES